MLTSKTCCPSHCCGLATLPSIAREFPLSSCIRIPIHSQVRHVHTFSAFTFFIFHLFGLGVLSYCFSPNNTPIKTAKLSKPSCHILPNSPASTKAVSGDIRFMRTRGKPPAAPECDWPKLQACTWGFGWWVGFEKCRVWGERFNMTGRVTGRAVWKGPGILGLPSLL